MTAKVTRDKIVDTALELAGQRSWEALRLHDVAATLHIDLNDLRQHFREKEDIVDAWFDRADAAMLRAAEDAAVRELPARDRLHRLIMIWLGALASHRRVTRQMIYNKFEPGHVHYQFTGLLRVSRTVQWLREAAHRDAVLPWRAFEESGLTAMYLATFFTWLRDDSENATRTSAFLDKLLRRAEPWARCLLSCSPTGQSSVKPSNSAGSAAKL